MRHSHAGTTESRMPRLRPPYWLRRITWPSRAQLEWDAELRRRAELRLLQLAASPKTGSLTDQELRDRAASEAYATMMDRLPRKSAKGGD